MKCQNLMEKGGELTSPRVKRNKTKQTQGDTTYVPKKTQQPEWADWKLPAQTELLLLWAISNSKERGIYGLDIQRAIAQCSGGNESISVGTLYSILKRLRKKGLVDSYEGDPIAGGAKRQYYFLTATGKSVVDYSKCFIARLSEWSPTH